MEARASPWTRGVVLTIVLFYAIAGAVLLAHIGPWEALRNAGVNGLIVVAWLAAAGRILRADPVPAAEPVRRPAAELAWFLLVYVAAVVLAANTYAGWVSMPSWVLAVVMCAGVLALFIFTRYPARALGLAWPSRRGWLALLAVVAINVAASVLFQLLPPGEAEPLPAADLANRITGPWSVVLLLVGLLLGAALPEELLLRVALQPRLARFVPLGWAILIQALLFSSAHLPQKLIGHGEMWPVALGSTLIVNNGLIGGYLWWRTRSLPLLLLLHLFAYARFGI